MSVKHPIISVIGSSGAGTSTVKHTFDQIFRREGFDGASIEGDAFHRFDRADMKTEMARRRETGDPTFSHFSADANLLAELEGAFRSYGQTGKCSARTYVHDAEEAERTARRLVNLPPGVKLAKARMFCFTRACMAR